MFGLDPDTTRNIKQACAKIPEIDKVVLYGSRAKGNYRNGSDIDITLFGENLSLSNSVYSLMDKLEELYLPYMFDISIFSDIDNEDLIQHINRVGKVFYRKEKGLPDGWEVKRLGEVCEFQRGLTYSKKDVVDFSENIVLRATNINLESSCLDFTELKYLDNNFLVKENKKLVKGALLICLSSGSKSHLGKIALVDDNYDYAFGGFIGQITPNKNISSKYLFYNLISGKYKTYIFKLTDGININNLKSVDLKAFQIPLPPLPEQKRIVALLDQAFTAINKVKANTEQNLRNARELFQSALQTEFDNGKSKIKNGEWEEKILNEISENLDSKRIPITKNIRREGSIPYYGASGIVDYVEDYLFDEDLLCISEDGANLLARTYPVAFSITGKTWVNNHAHVLRFNNLASQKFIELYINSIKLNNFVSGMAQPKLNQTMLNKIPIPFPKSLKVQKQIVEKLDALSTETKKLETLYQQKITDLDELKKSLLQKAFSGEL